MLGKLLSGPGICLLLKVFAQVDLFLGFVIGCDFTRSPAQVNKDEGEEAVGHILPGFLLCGLHRQRLPWSGVGNQPDVPSHCLLRFLCAFSHSPMASALGCSSAHGEASMD
ncbi:hypothetical protein MLD38_029377 [Melastoma candidum]|uniref:Uncharacterized protein n=1 Tax=Melastoma candidum TaxID=119954 RepID=A0ACB9N5E3_9MYRT|nr:hypothetical protein MLD38_029377 [Melastoma candidum]